MIRSDDDQSAPEVIRSDQLVQMTIPDVSVAVSSGGYNKELFGVNGLIIAFTTRTWPVQQPQFSIVHGCMVLRIY